MKEKTRLANFRHRILQAGVLACLVVLAGSGFAGIKDVYAQQSLQEQIDELRQQNQQNQSNVEKLREIATSYEDAIHTLEHDIEETEKAIAVSQQRQAEIEAEIKKAEAELEKQKGLLSQNIRAMYIEGDITTLEMLASSNNLSEFVDKQQYRDSIKNQISTTMDKINSLKEELSEQQKQVEVELATQEDSRARLAQSRREQSRLLALNESEQASFNRQTAKNKEKIQQLQAEQAALAARISSGNLVSQGSVKRGDIIGTVGDTGLSFGKHLHFEVRNSSGVAIDPLPFYNGADGWLRPVEGGFISQYFGSAWDIYGSGYHSGMDIAGVDDRPIRVAASGDIVRNCRGYCGGYGNSIMVRHSNGLFSLYAHMN